MTTRQRAPRTQRDLLARIENTGGTLAIRKAGHYVATTRGGRKMFLAQTPSDHRAILNAWHTWRRLNQPPPQ